MTVDEFSRWVCYNSPFLLLLLEICNTEIGEYEKQLCRFLTVVTTLGSFWHVLETPTEDEFSVVMVSTRSWLKDTWYAISFVLRFATSYTVVYLTDARKSTEQISDETALHSRWLKRTSTNYMYRLVQPPFLQIHFVWCSSRTSG